LSPRKLAADELDRIDSKNADLILIKGMKVGPMVRGQGLSKHPNDDTEEAGELGHRRRSFRDCMRHDCAPSTCGIGYTRVVKPFDIEGGESYVPAIRR
jgi:hypothetical protein